MEKVLRVIYWAVLGIFGVLYVYHVVVFYFQDLGCDFLLGTFNETMELLIFVAACAAVFLTLMQIVLGIVRKRGRRILIDVAVLAGVLILLWIFIGNTLLQCLFHNTDFSPLFMGPT